MQSKVIFTRLNKVCNLCCQIQVGVKEHRIAKAALKLAEKLFVCLFVCFCNVLTRKIIFDNTRLETSVCRVKAITLEIKKRHGNSKTKFCNRRRSVLDCREILIVSGKF